jgi:murein L,D-transpeptidase YcbB/YkuD
VTFEIDNSSTGGDWPVSDSSLDALIDVIVYHASQSPRSGRGFALNDPVVAQVEFFIAWHSQYKATACPGGYIKSKLDYIVSECNKRASGKPSKPSKPTTPTTPTKPKLGKWLRNGSTGDNVKYLQAALGDLKVDGIFGALTEKAVRKFQRQQKIQVDGIVGAQTWSRLP